MGKGPLHKLGICGLEQVPEINHIPHGVDVLHIGQKQQQHGNGQHIGKHTVHLFGDIRQRHDKQSEQDI
ncbi:hypothetical protein D3C75_1187050 [compost metagenome]